MNVKGLLNKYVVKKIGDSDIQDVFRLCRENKLYYEYCPPMVSEEIILEVCDHLRLQNFFSVRLAWVKGNPQAEYFWLKNKFKVLKETTGNVFESVILAERCL